MKTIKSSIIQFSAISLTVALVLVMSCKSKDDEPAPTLTITPWVTDVVFSADGSTLTSSGGEVIPSRTFTVNTNQKDWNVLPPSQSWVQVSKSGNSFTLSAATQTSATAPVAAEVTVTAGTASVKIGVTQEQLDFVIVADFVADITSTYTGKEITFTDQSINAESWAWTFEGGTPETSVEQNPKVTYAKAGRYKVSLQCSNSGFESSKEIDNYIYVVSGENLIAFFPFDGNISDAGPNAFDVELRPLSNTAGEVSDPNVIISFDADKNGVPNGAASFNGSGGFQIPNDIANVNGLLGEDDFSIAFWYHCSNETDYQTLWHEGGNDADLPAPRANRQALHRINSRSTTYLYFTATTQGTQITGELISREDWRTGTWRHVVCVKNGGTATMYLNGEVHLTDSENEYGIVSNRLAFKIGIRQNRLEHHQPYMGLLDNFIIYGRALTPEEVRELFEL